MDRCAQAAASVIETAVQTARMILTRMILTRPLIPATSEGYPEEAMPTMAACSNGLRERHARPRPREIAGNRAPCAHLSQNG
jgi:hypothetical protein